MGLGWVWVFGKGLDAVEDAAGITVAIKDKAEVARGDFELLGCLSLSPPSAAEGVSCLLNFRRN